VVDLETSRLLKVFEMASHTVYAKSSEKSAHWKRYDDGRVFSEENIRSFRGSGLSSSLDDGVLKERAAKTFFELCKRHGEAKVLDHLTTNNIGEADLYQLQGHYVDYGRLVAIEWKEVLEGLVAKHCTQGKIDIVCEIGGGYGNFIDLLTNRIGERYILIDLPEANLLSAYYLSQANSSAKFFLYDDYLQWKSTGTKTFEQVIDDCKFVILPPACLVDIVCKIDLVINTRSMMEMNKSSIENYFKFIHDRLAPDGLFLNINRYEKFVSDIPVRMHQFPYDSQWRVLYSEQAYDQPHVHMLVTQRAAEEVAGLSNELERIKELGKRYFYKKLTIKDRVMLGVGVRLERISKGLKGNKDIEFGYNVKDLPSIDESIYNI